MQASARLLFSSFPRLSASSCSATSSSRPSTSPAASPTLMRSTSGAFWLARRSVCSRPLLAASTLRVFTPCATRARLCASPSSRVLLTTILGYLSALPLPRLLGIEPRWGVAGLTISAASPPGSNSLCCSVASVAALAKSAYLSRFLRKSGSPRCSPLRSLAACFTPSARAAPFFSPFLSLASTA